jgi:hypothetical protein
VRRFRKKYREFGLRPGGAIGAYAPEGRWNDLKWEFGMRKAERKGENPILNQKFLNTMISKLLICEDPCKSVSKIYIAIDRRCRK